MGRGWRTRRWVGKANGAGSEPGEGRRVSGTVFWGGGEGEPLGVSGNKCSAAGGWGEPEESMQEEMRGGSVRGEVDLKCKGGAGLRT